MPKNPNESLSNNHALYVGVSGSGKTQALAQNVHLKNKSARVIYWDTHHSFKADHYNTIPELLKALKVAESKRGGYRIAYGGEKSPEAFDKLCSVNTLYFLNEPGKSFLETFRVLKNGGKIVIGFRDDKQMNHLNLSRDIFNTYSLDEVIDLLTNSGFTNTKIVKKNGKWLMSYCAVATKPTAQY